MLDPTRLRNARRDREMTQAALADACHVAQSCVSHWERGVRTPTLAHLLDLAEVLLVTPDHLLGQDPTPCAQP